MTDAAGLGLWGGMTVSGPSERGVRTDHDHRVVSQHDHCDRHRPAIVTEVRKEFGI
jgi:hypothetical protein